ncbi:hypothetical protein [Rhodopseudomonas palustris]|uniref:Uncharacterized protein n=1 Tax=Rhodopseudomonas palustris (strain ATCC BAA-98 / CGA009) TaxID=258594 RepID=A0AAE9Y3Q6_RHOPA|nr:hypothetical protein [Rhodopseudomonas palustris]WAB77434.1 hypothetical protein OR798_23600 [Rhodopseudomonas palustris]WCL94745.1 hypothetical protein TX73_023595 [Rhodopseudomonas palustris CGA009]WND51345.1 hypothetical protein L1A21_23515 [Rhodopseudomonas palustris]
MAGHKLQSSRHRALSLIPPTSGIDCGLPGALCSRGTMPATSAGRPARSLSGRLDERGGKRIGCGRSNSLGYFDVIEDVAEGGDQGQASAAPGASGAGFSGGERGIGAAASLASCQTWEQSEAAAGPKLQRLVGRTITQFSLDSGLVPYDALPVSGGKIFLVQNGACRLWLEATPEGTGSTADNWRITNVRWSGPC